ncbi:unnamed protein product [[Candida] boidinii]|nr:unnamed protein product [[Candida] boidinii]
MINSLIGIFSLIDISSNLSIAKFFALSTIEAKSLGVKPALCNARVSIETSSPNEKLYSSVFKIVFSKSGLSHNEFDIDCILLICLKSNRYWNTNFLSNSEGTLILISNFSFALIISEIESTSDDDVMKIMSLFVYSSINSANLRESESLLFPILCCC